MDSGYSFQPTDCLTILTVILNAAILSLPRNLQKIRENQHIILCRVIPRNSLLRISNQFSEFFFSFICFQFIPARHTKLVRRMFKRNDKKVSFSMKELTVKERNGNRIEKIYDIFVMYTILNFIPNFYMRRGMCYIDQDNNGIRK